MSFQRHQKRNEIWLVSKGSCEVFYSKDNFGDKVLGGGWIDKTFNKNLST